MYKEKDNTVEVYKGSLMEESAFVYNNILTECNYGLTTSPGLLIINNIFINSKTKAIERGVYLNDSNDLSITDYCDFYGNNTNFDNNVNLGKNNLINVNPQLNTAFLLKPGSPCIDKGVADYSYKNKKLAIHRKDYSGPRPDIGAFEYGLSAKKGFIPVISAGSDILLIYPHNKITLNGVFNDENPKNTMNISWSKISGPGTVQFTNPAKLHTAAYFSKQGIYNLKITASNSQNMVSDELTVYFVKDFMDKTIIAGKKKDVLFEAEDYRYLIGSAQVVPLTEPNDKVIVSDSADACTIYQISTKDASTFYLWVSVSAKNGDKNELSVSFNDIPEDIFISETTKNSTADYNWQKFEFNDIPEGIYPLIIKAKNSGLAWDKLFITCDEERKPF